MTFLMEQLIHSSKITFITPYQIRHFVSFAIKCAFEIFELIILNGVAPLASSYRLP